MPLDKDFQHFIEENAKVTGLPTIEDSSIDDLRASYEARYIARGPDYEEVNSVAGLTIYANDVAIPARLYKPMSCARSDALVIYFHGGGYVLGNIDAYDHQSRAMANKIEVNVLAIDYRLAPEHKFPAAAEDAIAAVLWAFDNAEQHGWSADKITVAGDSAGGALSAISAVAARQQGKLIASQILLYPSLNWSSMLDHSDGFTRYPSLVDFGKGYLLDWKYIKWFKEQYFSQPEEMLDSLGGNIQDKDLSGMPSTLVVTAGYDPLRDLAVHFCDRLVRAGVDVVYRNFPGMVHNFLGYVSIVKKADSAFEEVCALSKAIIKR